MRKKWMPADIGDIRGPFRCGWGNDSRGGIQYAVYGPNGWRYVIRQAGQYKEAREAAEKISDETKKGN